MLFASIHNDSLSQRDHVSVEAVKLQILWLINFGCINDILQPTVARQNKSARRRGRTNVNKTSRNKHERPACSLWWQPSCCAHLIDDISPLDVENQEESCVLEWISQGIPFESVTLAGLLNVAVPVAKMSQKNINCQRTKLVARSRHHLQCPRWEYKTS